MKKMFYIIVPIILIFLNSCQKFEYIGTKDGQTIFLDYINGKVVYINNSNRVIDYVDLKLNKKEIQRIRYDKEFNDSLHKMKDWGKHTIPGTKYTLELTTRFYNDKLLYILKIYPYDANVSRLAKTITVDMTDVAGFKLETIEPLGWTISVDSDGKEQRMIASGSVPITLENYLEIDDWKASWLN